MTKKLYSTTGILVLSVFLFLVSCNKAAENSTESIAGTYYGSFTRSSLLQSTDKSAIVIGEGTAEVSLLEDQKIEVHCYGEGIDTTFMLGYYENHDSVMVCLTGEGFNEMYGHWLGENHMGGGMMGDIRTGETEWMHHMLDEHETGDEHFGGFDMHMGTFTYSMKMADETGPYYLKFTGLKKNNH